MTVLERRRRIVARNSAGVPVRPDEPDAGKVLPYLTKAIDGRSVAVEFEARDVARFGGLNELGVGPAGGTFVVAPPDLETIPLRG